MEPNIYIPPHLSWSSVSTYSECGVKWLLSRGFKVPESTWYATLAGSAIHKITEDADRAEAAGIPSERQLNFAPDFKSAFDAAIKKATEAGKAIKPSGKVLKSVSVTGGPNKKDYDWWLHFGPIFVQKWMDFKASKGWRIAIMPDGSPGIEVGFEIELAGVPVVGYIDRVYTMSDGSIIVMDLKTGAVPSGSLQLVTYSAGLREAYGWEADWGVFWSPGNSADNGLLSEPIELPKWNHERITQMYAQALTGIKAGVFLPHVTNLCRGCTVRDHCWAVKGELSEEIPVHFDVIEHETGEVTSDRVTCEEEEDESQPG